MDIIDSMKPLDGVTPYRREPTRPPKILTQEEKSVLILMAINDFYLLYNAEPKLNRKNYREFELATKLQELRHNKDKFVTLLEHDEFNLLSSPPITKQRYEVGMFSKSE